MVDVLKHSALGRAKMIRALNVLYNLLILFLDLVKKQSDILQLMLSAVDHIRDLRLHCHGILRGLCDLAERFIGAVDRVDVLVKCLL